MNSQLINNLGIGLNQTDGEFPAILSGDLGMPGEGEAIRLSTPIDGATLGSIRMASASQVADVI